MIVKYIACIMCGKTIAVRKFEPQPFDIAPENFIVLQVREQVGGRRGQGFFNIPGEGKTILELWQSDDVKEREIAQMFKERLLTIIKAYIGQGIINLSEVANTNE